MTDGVFVFASRASTSRPFCEEPVKITLSTPAEIASRRRLDALGQDGKERGIEASSEHEARESQRDFARAWRGLELHGIASGERVQRLDRRQEERIVARADDEHHAKWPALHFKRNTLQPERAPAFSASARGQHTRGISLQPAARVGQGKDLGGEFFRERAVLYGPGGGGELRRVFRNKMAQFADAGEGAPEWASAPSAPGRRASPPISARLLSRVGADRSFEGRVHHTASKFSGASSGVSARSIAGAIPKIGQQQARTDARRFKDHRQPASGVSPAADEIHAIHILEAVVRTEVQHLVEAVREIERRALVNLVF